MSRPMCRHTAPSASASLAEPDGLNEPGRPRGLISDRVPVLCGWTGSEVGLHMAGLLEREPCRRSVSRSRPRSPMRRLVAYRRVPISSGRRRSAARRRRSATRLAREDLAGWRAAAHGPDSGVVKMIEFVQHGERRRAERDRASSCGEGDDERAWARRRNGEPALFGDGRPNSAGEHSPPPEKDRHRVALKLPARDGRCWGRGSGLREPWPSGASSGSRRIWLTIGGGRRVRPAVRYKEGCRPGGSPRRCYRNRARQLPLHAAPRACGQTTPAATRARPSDLAYVPARLLPGGRVFLVRESSSELMIDRSLASRAARMQLTGAACH